MEKQAVTIYTVAREARVSMATVSRVVNGNPNVKPETRQRVLDVIKKLNYRPNAVARGLASKKTTTIGVITPDFTNPYFAELTLGIDDVAKMYKYNMILTNSGTDPSEILKAVRDLMAKQVDGLIFMGNAVDDQLESELESSSIPVVVAATVLSGDKLPTVHIDYQQAAAEAIKLLLDHGDKKVGMVVRSMDYPINAEYRLSGYKQALEDAGQSFDDQLIFEAHDYQSAYDLAADIQKADVDGVYVGEDELAAGLLNGLTDAGVKVPADFELITANDSQYTTLTRPEMTSTAQTLYDIGAVAMRLLTKLMDGEELAEDDKHVVLAHDLDERQTTR